MKIRAGNYQAEIKNLKNSKFQGLSYPDFKEVNDSHLKYLNNLSDEEIKQRVKSVTITDLKTHENRAQAQKLLKDEGIFVIPNFLSEELKESLVKETKKAFRRIDELIEGVSGYYEDDDLVIQKEDIRIKGSKDLVNYGKPIVTVRQGQDQGMLDIFNYDEIPEIRHLNVRNQINETGLSGVMGNTERALSHINLYRNRGITQTRGFHMDDLNNTIKAFVYLSDVENLDDGPYCYCKGTHLPGAFRNTNIALSSNAPNKTEAPLVPMDSILPVLAKGGSLVVSDQTGIHRGIPQSEDAERTLLVTRFK